jgi:hypothetical protein
MSWLERQSDPPLERLSANNRTKDGKRLREDTLAVEIDEE